jgi:hypothetical protein
MTRALPVAIACLFSGVLTSSMAMATPGREVEAVKAMELRRFAVTTAGDYDTLETLLGDDLTYAHSSGVLDSKPQFMESLRSGRVRYQSIEPADLQIRILGTTAVIHGKAKVSLLINKAETKTLDLRFTDVWVKRKGRWQMVAWQSTRLP